MLDYSGYISKATSQTPQVINSIRLLMGPIPSIFMLGGIIFAIFYPLGRERHANVRVEIAIRKASNPS
jgi:GPH family glycoside/pentoside/hexuronide:cation symporter